MILLIFLKEVAKIFLILVTFFIFHLDNLYLYVKSIKFQLINITLISDYMDIIPFSYFFIREYTDRSNSTNDTKGYQKYSPIKKNNK